ncbi:hypothetical protein Krac_9778 [Ktedonobacter racemifer DSM 44963]|uniref:Uncharacterized protein n=1 Tax=Ktedonobacter racemifer DSM 44963 TaxID=485913 RepID=D6TDJ1_KTERA|nr:hypothetical protein Krac_9778 [Ktedonobacter racemifer DSM 44963]
MKLVEKYDNPEGFLGFLVIGVKSEPVFGCVRTVLGEG